MRVDHRPAIGVDRPEDQPRVGAAGVLGQRLTGLDLGAGELLAAVLVVVHAVTGLVAWWGGFHPLQAFVLGRSLRLRVVVGGQYAPLVDADPWRLVTCVLLHVDLLHLLLNALSVLAIGRALEPIVGRFRVVAWFCLSGVGGAAASHLAGVRQSDGASGGAFGLLAAGVVLAVVRRRTLDPYDRRLLGPVFGAFLALNLALSFVIPAIDPVAHLGGAAVGALWAAVPDRPPIRWIEALIVGGFVGACVFGWWLG